jgi:hypothetical protein
MSGCGCGEFLAGKYAEHGIEATVTDLPPLVPMRYEDLGLTCPHGTRWYAEPTTDQQAAWARDGVR